MDEGKLIIAHKGETWNESAAYYDAWTLRPCRRITTRGEINQAANYHTNIGFTDDGEFLVFWTKREDRGALCKAHVASGEIMQLTEAVSDYGFNAELQGGPYPRICIAPRSRWAVYTQGRALLAVHLDTLEERTLIADIGAARQMGYPSISADEQYAVVPTAPEHPEIVAGQRVTQGYFDAFRDPATMDMKLLQVPLAGGAATVAYAESGCRTAHCPHSPTDPDCLLLDRDFAPRYWAGQANRAHILQLSTREITPLPTRIEGGFQVHSCWTFDGQGILYHGPAPQGGQFIGVTDVEGQVMREYHFPDRRFYGHISAMPDGRRAILDGDLSDNLLQWLDYTDEQPRLEVIAMHNTEWGSLLGQATHPHPLSDPTERWISFTTAQHGRSDVVVVQVGP
ncbi:MAG: hypothetical protein ABI690_08560 [Chloroflexota bacterium]